MWEDADSIISSGRTPLHSFLAEPPHTRERLIQEIQFFISHLQRKEATNSISFISKVDPKHFHVVDYLANVGGVGRDRPQSAVSARDGRETPRRPKGER